MGKDKVCALLEDAQALKDGLGGAHKKLASSIIDMIAEKDYPGCTVGLEGTWGSGKTTIINIIRKGHKESEGDEIIFGLEDEKYVDRIATIYYDVWAHEGKALRRIFLEKLIDTFDKKGWFGEKAKEWTGDSSDDYGINGKKKEISGGVNKSTINESPKIAIWSVLLIFSTYLAPYGKLLIENRSKLLKIIPLIIPNIHIFSINIILYIISILIMISPLIIMLIIIYLSFICGKDLLNILLNKSVKTKRIEIVEISTPTSIEFEFYYRQILQDVNIWCDGNNPIVNRTSDKISKDNKNNRKLVFILDNLDRVSNDAYRDILNTLQIFLKYDDRDEEKQKNVWVIIPYDRRGLEKYWESDTSLYLQKRFQIIFHVPPIIETQWRKFFMTKMEEAFPYKNSVDPENPNGKIEFINSYYLFRYTFYLLSRNKSSTVLNLNENNKPNFDKGSIMIQNVNTANIAYGSMSEISTKDIQSEIQKLSPTPREIIFFINRIFAISIQNENNIPLNDISYFVCLQSIVMSFDEIGKMALSETLYSQDIKGFVSKYVHNNLAIMLFNVDKKIAKEIFLKSRLPQAIYQGRFDSFLKEFGETAISFIDRNLQDKIDKDAIDISKDINSPLPLLILVYYMEVNNLASSFVNGYDIIRGLFDDVKEWNIYDPKAREYLLYINTNVFINDDASKILMKVVINEENTRKEDITLGQYESIIAWLRDIANFRNQSIEEIFPKNIPCICSSEGIIFLCSSLDYEHDNYETIWKNYHDFLGFENIVFEEIKNLYQLWIEPSDKTVQYTFDKHIGAIKYLFEKYIREFPWDKMSEIIMYRLRQSPFLRKDEKVDEDKKEVIYDEIHLSKVLEVFFLLGKKNDLERVTKSEGYILSWFNLGMKKQQYKLAAWAFYLQMFFAGMEKPQDEKASYSKMGYPLYLKILTNPMSKEKGIRVLNKEISKIVNSYSSIGISRFQENYEALDDRFKK